MIANRQTGTNLLRFRKPCVKSLLGYHPMAMNGVRKFQFGTKKFKWFKVFYTLLLSPMAVFKIYRRNANDLRKILSLQTSLYCRELNKRIQ